MNRHQSEHGAESSGRSQSAETRPGEGGEERATYRHPDTHREEMARPGAPREDQSAEPGVAQLGDADQDAFFETQTAPVSGRAGHRTTGSEDVLDLDESLLVEAEEPDFADDTGTTDVMLAVEEGLTYFPPTDPVVEQDADADEGIEVLGGFSSDALESPLEADQLPPRLRRGDDELAEAVRRALRADSYTTDMDIDVTVEDAVVYLRGVVQSLDDIEQAEEVAGRVPGVEDVEEELEIA
jgi:hypothetical protein